MKTYKINGQQVLLDFQLAELLNEGTAHIKSKISANRRFFPSDFICVPDKAEWKMLQAQYKELKDYKGSIPYSLTAGGICMLCQRMPNNLKATEISTQVIRTYVKMRKYQPAFIGIEKQMKAHEHNTNLKHFDIYKLLVQMAV